ncbi:hypothetical protein AB0M57_31490 [Streptomyces sp. NPDC051597]|uniref:hypothetical protein n=1 Tax=Streptomyces sp. NPDC051597 TaxID=3155049 RepID=UPI003434B72A
MAKKLWELEDDARADLGAKAAKAMWAGVNATVTKGFITKTTKEFADAATEATSIGNILRDTHSELVDYKARLDEALRRGLEKNLTVAATGDGAFTVTMNIHPDRAAKGHSVPEHTEADATALRDEVQRILEGATEGDSTAAQALTMLVSQTPYGFSDAAYYDRDRAADAMKDADRIANLLKGKGDTMSPEEFDQLNRDLAKYKDDRLFQETLATTLGPRGVLSTSGPTSPTPPTAARCSARATTSSVTSSAPSPSPWRAPPSPTARPCGPGRTTWSNSVKSASTHAAARSTAIR